MDGHSRRALQHARSSVSLTGLQKLWSWRGGLNSRPVDYESTALPTELRQRRLQYNSSGKRGAMRRAHHAPHGIRSARCTLLGGRTDAWTVIRVDSYGPGVARLGSQTTHGRQWQERGALPHMVEERIGREVLFGAQRPRSNRCHDTPRGHARVAPPAHVAPRDRLESRRRTSYCLDFAPPGVDGRRSPVGSAP